MSYFKAPWSRTLIVLSSLTTVLCLTVALWQWHTLAAMHIDTLRFWLALLPLALVLGAALFTVRGYSVAADEVLVHRLFWTTRLPRKEMQSARFEPEAIRRSIRIFGNGGL